MRLIGKRGSNPRPGAMNHRSSNYTRKTAVQLLWHVVDAATVQPNPTPELRHALNILADYVKVSVTGRIQGRKHNLFTEEQWVPKTSGSPTK